MKSSAELVAAEVVAAASGGAACAGECEKPPADVELVRANGTDTLYAFAEDLKPLPTGGLAGSRTTADCQLLARGDLVVTAFTGVAAAPFCGPMLLSMLQIQPTLSSRDDKNVQSHEYIREFAITDYKLSGRSIDKVTWTEPMTSGY